MTTPDLHRCPACGEAVVDRHECTELWADEFGMKGHTTTRCEVTGGRMSVSIAGGSTDAMEALLGMDADPNQIPEAER